MWLRAQRLPRPEMCCVEALRDLGGLADFQYLEDIEVEVKILKIPSILKIFKIWKIVKIMMITKILEILKIFRILRRSSRS